MPSLSELQAAFARAVFEREATSATEWIVAGRGLDGQARIGVYRNNILASYRAALREVYPVVLALVGEPFFHRAAETYAANHPSRSGDLNDFGGEFGDFLGSWPPAARLSYLPDVARLEWAVERVFHAADTAPLDLRELADVPEEARPELRFAPNPANRIVCSPFPILRIWRANQMGFDGDPHVNLDAGGEAVLVRRRGSDVELEALSPGELELLRALAADLTLKQAHAQALETEPGLDLAVFLQRHALGGTLVAFRNDQGVTT